jgi:uncharacterized protein (DUF169 family)
MTSLKVLSDEFRDLLRLSGYPVTVKLLKSIEGFEEFRPKQPFALCQFISLAWYRRSCYLGTAESLSGCWGGLTFTGIAEMPANVKDGKRYAGWQFLNEDVSRKFAETLPKFEVGTYKAVLISPLEICPTNPDVVLFYGNSAQMTVLCGAYLYNKGECLNFRISGTAGCSHAVVEPIQTGKPNLVVPCNGYRLMALQNDTDLIFAVPFKSLEELLDGIKFFRERGGPTYPPGWQHLTWEAKPPITYITDPKGPGPVWLKSK